MVFIDNRYVEGSSTPISARDDEGDTYQDRTLEDGARFRGGRTVILCIDTDGVLYVYESEEEVFRNVELTDIEHNEYEFCDEKGRRLVGEMTKPSTFLRTGTFRLIPEGETDPALPLLFVERARELGRAPRCVSSLDALRAHLTRRRDCSQ